MKTLIFVNGPPGVGKTTLSQLLHCRLMNSAWLQSEWVRATNPFVANDEMSRLTERNMSFLLRSYLECTQLDYVILTYGLHAHRKAIFDNVIRNIGDIDHRLVAVTLWCSEEEHLRRLRCDARDADRIAGNLSDRPFYESLTYPVIDTTTMTVDQTADAVMTLMAAA